MAGLWTSYNELIANSLHLFLTQPIMSLRRCFTLDLPEKLRRL